jgi:hypothetical protein
MGNVLSFGGADRLNDYRGSERLTRGVTAKNRQ